MKSALKYLLIRIMGLSAIFWLTSLNTSGQKALTLERALAEAEVNSP